MKQDHKPEWIKNIEFEADTELITFKELAVGLLFCALCIAAGIVVLWIRRGCVGA